MTLLNVYLETEDISISIKGELMQTLATGVAQDQLNRILMQSVRKEVI